MLIQKGKKENKLLFPKKEKRIQRKKWKKMNNYINGEKKSVNAFIPTGTDRKLRRSTLEITKERVLQREMELSQIPRKNRETKIIKKFSQEYLLAEAKETEKKKFQR